MSYHWFTFVSKVLIPSEILFLKLPLVFIKFFVFLDEEEEDDVVAPKPPVEPEEEKTLKKEEENESKGNL